MYRIGVIVELAILYGTYDNMMYTSIAFCASNPIKLVINKADGGINHTTQ